MFRAHLSLIDDVLNEVCRRAGLRHADAEDFASSVKLALIENDYAILRSWRGESSLGGYLITVVGRLLSDQRTRELGRWRPSAEAIRQGAAAVLLETLMRRDGRSFEEALPLVLAHDPSLTPDAVRAIAECLPRQAVRPRVVALDAEISIADRSPGNSADARVRAEASRDVAEGAVRVLRRVLGSFPAEDMAFLRKRFAQSMSIADIARVEGIPQRPLYRRQEALLARLRRALTEEGLDPQSLLALIGDPLHELDFLNDSKSRWRFLLTILGPIGSPSFPSSRSRFHPVTPLHS